MSDFDPLSFFDEQPAEAAAPVAVETPAAAPTEAVETPAATPAVDKPEFEGAPTGFVPVGALTAERTKRQTLEEQIKAAKQAPVTPEIPFAPPAVGTPEHAAYLQDQLVQTQIDSRFNLSEARFVAANGAEEAKKLQDWVETQDVFFFQRLLNSPDPYALAKADYDRDNAATAYKDIPQDQFQAFLKFQEEQKAAAAAAEAQAANPTVTPATPPVVVAPSVAAAAAKKEGLQKPVSSGTILTTPSASGVKPGETPAAPGAAFADVF